MGFFIDDSDEVIIQGLSQGVPVTSEEGYRRLLIEHPPPEGYIWTRSPFGGGNAKWKATIGEEPTIRSVDNKLEQNLRDKLKEWGYWQYFAQDVKMLGRQLDFADTENKVDLEPGAVYWHTPDGCQGDSVLEIGMEPRDVYSPVKEADIEKQKTLIQAGWNVLWMTEEGVYNQSKDIKNWLDGIYKGHI